MSTKPNPLLTQAFNDVLAKMMQAEVSEGGPPPAASRDSSVEVLSQIHMTDPVDLPPSNEETVPITKQEFEKTLTEQLDRLRDEIHEMRTRSVTLSEATFNKWSETMADLEAKQKAAREMLGRITTSTGAAWEHLRDGGSVAWDELEKAVRKARTKF